MLLFAVSVLQSQSTTFDLFPLKKNIHYSYDYNSKGYMTEMIIRSLVSIDSGIVDYTVLDSTRSSDTAIVWKLSQVRHLSRWQHYGHDTTYYIIDSSVVLLFENTDGMHSMKASGFIWNFPFSDSAQQVYRYGYASQSVIAYSWNAYYSSESDSLKFGESKGYYYGRFGYSSGSPQNNTYRITTVLLLGSPEVAVARRITDSFDFKLCQNYPNPFNPMTFIDFVLPHPEYVTVKVFNLLGEEVALLLSQYLPEGKHTTKWNATGLSSGVYFYKIQAGGAVQTRKLLLLR